MSDTPKLKIKHFIGPLRNKWPTKMINFGFWSLRLFQWGSRPYNLKKKNNNNNNNGPKNPCLEWAGRPRMQFYT